MAIPIILTLIIMAYAFINLPFVNQFASPFLGPVLLYVVWMLKKNYDLNKEHSKEIDELKEIIKDLNKNNHLDE